MLSAGLGLLFLAPLNLNDRTCLPNFSNIYRLETEDGVTLTEFRFTKNKMMRSFEQVWRSTQMEWVWSPQVTEEISLGESFYEPNLQRQEWNALTCDGPHRLIKRRVIKDSRGVSDEQFGRPGLTASFEIWDYISGENRVVKSTQSEHYYSPQVKDQIELDTQFGFELSLHPSRRPNRMMPPQLELKSSNRHTCYRGVVGRRDWALESKEKGLPLYSGSDFPIAYRDPDPKVFEQLVDSLYARYKNVIRYGRRKSQ